MSADIVQARYTELEGVAGRFAGAGERVQEVARGVQGRADVLRRGGWEGHGQAAFLAELDALVLPSLGRLAAALQEAQRVTAQMSATVHSAEEEAARLFQAAGSAAGGSGSGSGNEVDAAPDADFDLASLAAFLGLAAPKLVTALDVTGFISQNRTAIKQIMLAIGRGLNEATGRRGYVGIMNKLYKTLIVNQLPHRGAIAKLIGHGGFGVALGVADGFFGAVEDWQNNAYGGNRAKIIGVNSLNAGMQIGIGMTGVGTAILTVNAVNQGIGALEVGAMSFYADRFAANPTMHQLLENDAVDMEAAYKKMKLTNITKELSEGIWDGYSELLTPHRNMAGAYWNAYNELQRDPSLATMGRVTSNLAQVGRDNLPGLLTSTLALSTPATGWMFTQAGSRGAVDVLKATGNVVDGLADSVVIRSTSGYTRWTNSLVRDVNYLPISDGMKRQINGAAQDAASRVQTGRTWLTGLVDMKTGDDE